MYSKELDNHNVSTISMMGRMDHYKESSENVIDSNIEMFYNTDDVQFKQGSGLYNLVFRNDSVETNVDYPSNPGFTFQPESSELRTGKHLHVTTDIEEISWGPESWYINPMVKYFPPTAASPYNLFVRKPLEDLQRLVSLAKEGLL